MTHKEKNRVAQKRFRQRQKVRRMQPHRPELDFIFHLVCSGLDAAPLADRVLQYMGCRLGC